MAIRIEELPLSVRAYNPLKRAGINYIEDFDKYTPTDIKNLPGFGLGCHVEVEWALAHFISTRKCGDTISAQALRDVIDEWTRRETSCLAPWHSERAATIKSLIDELNKFLDNGKNYVLEENK